MAKESGEEKVWPNLVGDFAGGSPVIVQVKDNRIIRTRPMIFKDDEVKPWKIKVGNRLFTASQKTKPSPFDLAVRRRVYNDKRVGYPLKRESFNPGGKSSTENRGKDKFVRISWDEALDIIASELQRIKETYGNSAILTIGGGHGQGGLLNSHGLMRRFLNLWGGQTPMMRNPDSWEGWYWGAEHVWGYSKGNGLPPQSDMLEDTMLHSDFMVFWSYDPEQSGWMAGQYGSSWLLWLKELGKKMVFISPDCNYTASTKADKWFPILPGTDAALAAAIAYVWIDENTYDDDYVRTHGVGFEKWKDYVLGKEDGVPKTPKWAEDITRVPARDIYALAREWASKRTSLTIRYGAACRTPYATEWTRMMVFLQAMQGLGKPGVGIHALVYSAPSDYSIKIPGKLDYHPKLDSVAQYVPGNPVKQAIYQTLIPQSILDPPVSWYSGNIRRPTEEQFNKLTYPMPGNSEVHMIWWDTVSNLTNWNSTNKWAQAYRSPKIEFSLAQSIFLENDALFADIVLPQCTQFETDDFGYVGLGPAMGRGSDSDNFVIVYMKQCIEPVGESKSNYETVRLIAERFGLEKEYTEGNSVEDWMRKFYEASSLPEYISFEEFKDKGYYVFKFPDDWPRMPGMKQFYDTATGLETPSGKIEFFSQRLAEKFPDDKERPPVPHYIDEGSGHQEKITSVRAKKFPLLVESPHPRYRFHSQHDTVTWLNEIPFHKVHKDGYYYESLWMNPEDARPRNIKDGDMVRIFNERGSVITAVCITERIIPGVVRIPNGSGYNPVKVGESEKGGAINTITPLNTISKNVFGMAVNAFLVEVEKWEGN